MSTKAKNRAQAPKAPNANGKEEGAGDQKEKPKSNWKQKLVDLIGQRCCWNINADCCEDCKNVWRCWICLASFYTLIFSAFEFAFMIHLFLPYSDNTSIFIADKLKKLFILNDNMFPVWTLSTTVCTFFLSVWSLIFAIQPSKGRSAVLIAYKLISSIVVLSCFVLSIVQIVLSIIEWPDDKFKLELERVMRNDMEFGRPPDLIRKNWVDTQDAFQCCGIYSWVDWFGVGPNSSHAHVHSNSELAEIESARERALPLSCCAAEHDFCTETNVFKTGCLEEQVYQMKTYSLFNTVFVIVLYHLTNWLSLSIQKYFKKFPVREISDEENPDGGDGKPPPGSKNGKLDANAKSFQAQARNGKSVNKVQSADAGISNSKSKPPPYPYPNMNQKSFSEGSLPRTGAANGDDDDAQVILPPPPAQTRRWSQNDL